MRKIMAGAVLAAFCLLAPVSAVAGGQAMTAESGDFRDVLNKANQQLTKINSYHMTMELTGYCTIDGKDAYFVASGETDARLKPMLMKNVITVTADVAGARNETTFTQYTEEAGDKLSVYTHTDGKWYRQVMASPVVLANREEIIRKNLDLFAKVVDRVTLARETDEALFLDVTVNLGALLAGVGEVLALPDGNKLAIPKEFAAILKEPPALAYTVEIDKKTMLYSSVSFDLSPLFGFIGEKIVAAMKVPPEKKASMLETLNTVKIQGTIAFSRYNAIAPISIPPEAKNAPLLTPKPPVKPDPAPPTKPGAVPPAKQPPPGTQAAPADGIGTEQGTPGTQADFSQNTMSGA